MFPILFLSGVFFPIADAPQWIKDFANIFPVAHLIDSFTALLRPGDDGQRLHLRPGEPARGWTAVGLFVATRRFRVEMTAAGGDRRACADRLTRAGVDSAAMAESVSHTPFAVFNQDRQSDSIADHPARRRFTRSSAGDLAADHA